MAPRSGGRRDRRRRALAMLFWRVVSPPTRPLSGWAPWWALLETRGRRTGAARRVPLARGPIDDGVALLIAVHGDRASFVRNIAADPRVRLKLNGRWHEGAATVGELDDETLRCFNAYARGGPRTFGIEPRLVRIRLDAAPESRTARTAAA